MFFDSCGHAPVWRCFLVPHLKTGNSEAPGIVRGRTHGHQVGAVGDVLVIELHRHLVVTCNHGEPLARFLSLAPDHNHGEIMLYTPGS